MKTCFFGAPYLSKARSIPVDEDDATSFIKDNDNEVESVGNGTRITEPLTLDSSGSNVADKLKEMEQKIQTGYDSVVKLKEQNDKLKTKYEKLKKLYKEVRDENQDLRARLDA